MVSRQRPELDVPREAERALAFSGSRPAQTVDGIRLRRVLQACTGQRWEVPKPFGLDGWSIRGPEHVVIVSAADGYEHQHPEHPEWAGDWIHASMRARVPGTRQDNRLPSYQEMCWLKEAVFGPDGWAYQIHAPAAEHVNVHEFVLHLWGRADGRACMPDFTRGTGNI